MLRGIKRRLEEAKERKELERQEIAQQKELARQAEEERRRNKLELQNRILAILEEGKVPDLGLNISVPFRLLKNERWILAADGVMYAEMRTKREIQGRSAGASFRVAKGVSLRTGRSRGTPVETDVLTARGSGIFALSTRHVYFHGERSFRISLGKIVSVQSTPTMGLEIVREPASAQPEYFGLPREDAEFIASLIHLLPEVDFGKGEPQMQPVESYLLPFGDMGADDMLDQD